MAAILNSAILDSAILHKTLTQSNSIWLKLIHSDWTWWWQPSWIQPFAQKNLHSCILTQLDDGSHLEFCHLRFSHFAQKNFTCSFWFNLMMAAILNSAILDSAILHKKNFHLSFWLNLMMMALLNSDILDSETAILDSVTLLSSLTFTEKHSHCTLTPTQTNSIWLKLLHSHSTWWFQPSWTLPSFIQPFYTKKHYSIILTQLDDGSHLEFCHSWIQTLPSWIQTSCYLLSDSLKNTLPPLWLWLKLMQSD